MYKFENNLNNYSNRMEFNYSIYFKFFLFSICNNENYVIYRSSII